MTVKKPILCPHEGCNIVTAVPIDCSLYLTSAAAGFFPHGFRCRVHKHDLPDVSPQPFSAPPRMTEAQYARYRTEKAAAEQTKAAA